MQAEANFQSPVKLKPSEYQLSKKFEQLYNESSRKKQKLQQMKEERQRQMCQKELKECTFHPKVNPDHAYYGSKPSSFIKRQQDWLTRKQKRIQEMTKQSQTKGIQACSFHPVISTKTIEILQNTTKYAQKQKKVSAKCCKKPKNSYRQIHKKKQSEKNGQGILLMTQKRSQMKKILQKDSQKQQQTNNYPATIQSRKPIRYSNHTKVSQSLCSQSQQTPQIPGKTEQQDTFNSISSMEVKVQQNRQTKQEKSRIMILEDEVPENSIEGQRINLEGEGQFVDKGTVREKQVQNEESSEQHKIMMKN